MIGKKLGHYEILDLLDKGGMGEVYLARDIKLKREVALKVLPPQLTADEERRLRFQREAETAASLSHPNITVIHEIGEADGTPFLVMELLKGRTLKDVLAGRGLDTDRWLGYALPIAEAIAHAHRNGVIHRDLKATNVMITEEGTVKLLDFGLAKLLEPAMEDDTLGGDPDNDIQTILATISRDLTERGRILGTVAYMSPEQARAQPADQRSDIFSFGVLLYEMAAGRLPFTGSSDIESLSATLSQDPPSLSDVREELPVEIGRIVGKALEKEPAHRYQSADDMVADFRTLRRDTDTGRTNALLQSGEAGAVAGGTAGHNPARRWGLLAAILATLALGAWGVTQFLGDDGGEDRSGTERTADDAGAAKPNRILVLPFRDLGTSQDEYFAAGVTEEIIGRLTSVRELSVISRTSAFEYNRDGKSLQQIGEDFQVDHILVGTVRWARSGELSQVRIAPELIRVSDETSIWAESYDSPLDDVFQVQSAMAKKVIEALGVALLAGERESLESSPTESMEAYRAYVRGIEVLDDNPLDELAEQMLQHAVDLDPEFAQAWARLSRAHSWRYHGGDRTEAREQSAKAAVDEALRLAPDAAETRIALALYYYRCFRDYDRALTEIAIAQRARPNDADILSWRATFNKRQGNFREAIRLHRQAFELDPMDQTPVGELAVVHKYLREYEESDRWGDRALALKPDLQSSYFRKALLYFSWKGDTVDARKALEAMPSPPEPLADMMWFWLEYYEGRFDEALARVERFPEMIEDQVTLNVRAMLAALCHEQLGDDEAARASWEEAVVILERRAAENPDDFRAHANLGQALAAVGRDEEAIAAADRAVELLPYSKDAEAAVGPRERRALALVRMGDLDRALQEISDLLARPGTMSIALLRLDPRWKLLVEHPGFEELARNYEGP